MNSLGVATLGSEFDAAGLKTGLDRAHRDTQGWLSGWQQLWATTGGFIIAQVIGRIVGAIKDLGRQVLDAVSQFQLLEIQLQGLVAGEMAADGVMSFADAMDAATPRVKELIGWIQELAVTTPFTVQTLQRTLANAMAMGFTSKEAQSLTKSIGNFTAGMGLSQEVMERVIYNFGQMKAAGKVTGTELRDLARGGFVPVVDLLHRMQTNMGLSNLTFEAFRKQVSSGQVDVNEFFKAFEQMSSERFPNAMERMAKTFSGLMGNVKDFIQSVLGVSVFGPLFNKVTEQLADAFQLFLDPKIRREFDLLGYTLSKLFDFKIDPVSLVDRIADSLHNLSVALLRFDTTKDPFQFLKDIGVDAGLVDTIQKIFDGMVSFGSWIKENWDAVLVVLGAVAFLPQIISFVLWLGEMVAIFGMLVEVSGGVVAAIGALFTWLGGPIVIAIVAIVAALVLLYLAWTRNWGGIQEKVAAVWAFLQEFFAFLVPMFEDLKAQLGPLGEQFKAAFGPLIPQLLQLWEALKPILIFLGTVIIAVLLIAIGLVVGLLSGIIGFFTGFLANIGPVIEYLAVVLQGVIGIVTGFFNLIVSIFTRDGELAKQALLQLWYGILDVVGGLALMLWSLLVATFEGLVQLVMNFITSVIAYFTQLYMALVGGSIVPDMLNAIMMWFSNVFSIVMSIVISVLNTIVGAFLHLASILQGAVFATLQALNVRMKSFINNAGAMVAFVRGALMGALEALADTLRKLIGLVQQLASKLSSLKPPKIFTPGSPTPFEVGLWGIYDAMSAIESRALPALGEGLSSELTISGSATADESLLDIGAGSKQTKQFQFNMQKSDLDEDQLTRILTRTELLYG